jgi:hypothetical protein
MELFHANRQWATRPADQTFSDLQTMHETCKHYADQAVEKDGVLASTLRTENINGDVHLVGKGGLPAKLTHWSFGQLAQRVAAPADYLRALPATLAVQNLNHGLAARVDDQGPDSKVNLLFHSNGGYVVRSFNGARYSRIWNHEITARLLQWVASGQMAPAMPDIRQTGTDHPALYASDHDMFAFLCSDRIIAEPGRPEAGLKRGSIVRNSEVGGGSAWRLDFLYREMCGNHIIWGAENVVETSIRHVGNAAERFADLMLTASEYLDSSADAEEQKIARWGSVRIAGDREKVLDAVFSMKAVGLSRKAITAGLDANVADLDGDPLTPWGLAQGLTRHSQTIAYADKRAEMDRAAGRLLEAF